MKNNVGVIAIVAVLVGSGLGFFGGMQYQKSQRPNFGNSQFDTRFRNKGGGVVGDILSVDKNSITVKLPDGSVTAANIQINQR